MISQQEIADIALAFTDYQEWTGPLTAEMLEDLVEQELSERAIPLSPLLHIVSGNTAHAAFQSTLRGLLTGAQNLVKLPSAGLPLYEDWHSSLPPSLKQRIELSHKLSDAWRERAEAVVIYGSDATISEVSRSLRPDQRVIAHGHKLSIGVVDSAHEDTAALAATDVARHNQLGCLSLVALYTAEENQLPFAHRLAHALADIEAGSPRGEVDLSVSGAIQNLRSLAAFQPTHTVISSPGSTAWTVIVSPEPALETTPLHRCVWVKPLPKNLSDLGPASRYLSTVALYPFTDSLIQKLSSLPASRLCPLGQAQNPPISWNPDGYAPLAALVKWRTIG